MANLDDLVDEVFASLPLPFIREFLRTQKAESSRVRIGSTIPEVRANLRDALTAHLISGADVRLWLQRIEGYGRQHLYLYRVPRRSLTHAHLLSAASLRAFLRRRRLLSDGSAVAPGVHRLSDVIVDDEFARLIWQALTTAEERRDDFDEKRELAEGDFLFKAYRLTPKRSACQLLVRKTDGVVVHALDLPLNDEHETLRTEIDSVAQAVVAPLQQSVVSIAPIVSRLDEAALSRFGPRAQRGLALGVEPTQARFSAEGARIDFRSTRETVGYTDSSIVRRARRALEVEKVLGEAGKFRLTFTDKGGRPHTMVVSFDAKHNRMYLFSQMTEAEVLALVDQIVAISP